MFYVYILTNRHRTVFYTGVTNDIERRTYEHILKRDPNGFCERYNLNELVYYETYNDPKQAIRREKVVKKKSHLNKIKLIESLNPDWNNLFE